MMKEARMQNIVYFSEGTPYLNLTNDCPCRCTFCVRDEKTGWGDGGTLWLSHNPAWTEIRDALDAADFSAYREAVFCGFGEPLCALDNLTAAAVFLKARYPTLPLRVNTNGLGDLINRCDSAAPLVGYIDTFSVSLNAPDAVRYAEITRPVYGAAAFAAMLSFAARAKARFPQVIFTVVDEISDEEIVRCQALADNMGIPLRVRRRV
jgi:TatD family-associated radical SAM protein